MIKLNYPNKVIESIAKVSILKIELMCKRIKKFTASLSIISVSVHRKINCFPDEYMIETFPTILLNFFREERKDSSVIIIREEFF
jgi:hypothetical protein